MGGEYDKAAELDLIVSFPTCSFFELFFGKQSGKILKNNINTSINTRINIQQLLPYLDPILFITFLN